MKSSLNYFTIELSRVRWALDLGVLAHLTNGVLLETTFWDELQQKECKSISEFYTKASKLLKLGNSKEALHKAKEASTNKKNSKEIKMKIRKGARREKEKISKEIALRNHTMELLIVKHHY